MGRFQMINNKAKAVLGLLNNFRRAVTLPELLMVIALLSMTAVTIFHTMINGYKVWGRTQQFVVEQDIAILFDKISEEIRNSIYFSQIKFEGRSSHVRFPAVVRTLPDPRVSSNGDYVIQLGQVEYLFDPLRKSLNRRYSNYSLALRGMFFPEQQVLTSIRSVKFSYYYPDENGRLIETEKADVLPSAFQIVVGYYDSHGREKFISKIVFLPLNS